MKFKRQAGQEVSVNLTPLIDIVFLLLIFFMVSTTLTQKTKLSIDLPTAQGDSSKPAPNKIEVMISRSGEYAVNGQALINNKLKTLARALEKKANGNTNVPLIITADAGTPHQAVVTAMDAAGRQGFAQLSITTRRDSSE